jgi:Helix-turn-helix domain
VIEPIALSQRDAAAPIGVSLQTMARLVRSRKVAARKAGKRILIDAASLRAFYEGLPEARDVPPLVFGWRAKGLPPSLRAKRRHH